MKKKLFKTVTVHSCESMSIFYACVALSLHNDKTVTVKHTYTLSDLKVERKKALGSIPVFASPKSVQHVVTLLEVYNHSNLMPQNGVLQLLLIHSEIMNVHLLMSLLTVVHD